MGGGSDDIGDISWNVPTVTLRYPANIPGLPGHNWSSAIASATPIAHKGVVAGAKVQAMTILDILTKPEIVKQAWDYFNNVQTKDVKYIPFIKADTPAPTFLNTSILVEVPRGDEEVLLRPEQVPDLPGSARHQVPDGADRAGDPAAERAVEPAWAGRRRRCCRVLPDDEPERGATDGIDQRHR